MTRCAPLLAAALMIVAVGACDNTPVRLQGALAPVNCPPDPTPVALGGGWFHVDTTKQHYVDIVIDGVVARRNVPSKSSEPLGIPNFPMQSEIKRIWLAGWHMSSKEITAKYGTCPGMDAWIYETASGNWRPLDVEAPRSSVPTSPISR